MSPGRLLQYFDQISEAPEAVPRMRRFILYLAVRGKLVEQGPADEPTDSLICGIAAERKRLAGEGKPVSAQASSASDNGGVPIPQSWCWVRLGFVTNVLMGQSPPGETYNTRNEGVPLINGPAEFSEGPFGITVVNQYTTSPTKLCEKGDLLLCVRGSTTGRTNVAGFSACIGRGVAALQSLFPDHFVRLFVWFWRDRILEMGRGIAFPSISRQQIEDLPVPLPPLAEQHRIVTKVDELMALCDELEAAQAKRERRRDRLVAATLQGLNNGDTSPEPDTRPAFTESARFYFIHLPCLTTRPEHIRQLRQTILNLAVRGQLVPQNPKDEPATELLKRIEAEKALLTKDGRIKKQEPLPNGRADVPFRLPLGWVMGRIQEIFVSAADGDHLPPPKTEEGIPLLVIGDVRSQSVDFTGCRYVSKEYYGSLDPVRRPANRDILYTLVGSYGIPVMITDDRPFCVQRHIGILRPSKHVDVGFLARVLESRWVFDQATACATGIAQKTVPLSGLRNIRVPLPPLAEQHRIVAKVDKIMGLCNELEARLITSATIRRQLLEATLAEALGSDLRNLEGIASNGQKGCLALFAKLG